MNYRNNKYEMFFQRIHMEEEFLEEIIMNLVKTI